MGGHIQGRTTCRAEAANAERILRSFVACTEVLGQGNEIRGGYEKDLFGEYNCRKLKCSSSKRRDRPASPLARTPKEPSELFRYPTHTCYPLKQFLMIATASLQMQLHPKLSQEFASSRAMFVGQPCCRKVMRPLDWNIDIVAAMPNPNGHRSLMNPTVML